MSNFLGSVHFKVLTFLPISPQTIEKQPKIIYNLTNKETSVSDNKLLEHENSNTNKKTKNTEKITHIN